MAFRAVMVSIAVVVLGVALGRALQLLPEPLRLPPFDERVVLKVEARWSGDGCMDVVTITNLPPGTHFTIVARPQFERRGDRTAAISMSFRLSQGFRVVSTTSRMTHRDTFCTPYRWSNKEVFSVPNTEGIVLTVRVAQLNDFHRWKQRPKTQSETPAERRQRQLIGERGQLLKGPLVRKKNWVPGSNPGFYAESNPFVIPFSEEEKK